MSDGGMNWRTFRRRLKAAAPDRPYYLMTTAARTLERLPADLLFRRTAIAEASTPLPPPYLRYRVSGSYDVEQFHSSGLEGRVAFEQALESIGHSMIDRTSVLDFGVGCSRILRWMEPYADSCLLAGSDIDDWAVSWSQRHVPFAVCKTNGGLPPLKFGDDAFDLVYSHSVFTHLDQSYQEKWLEELRRVLRPGGVALLTVHGNEAFTRGARQLAKIDPARAELARKAWDAEEFFFDTASQWNGVFPDFYQNSYQSLDYTKRVWSQVMPVVNYLPGGMRSTQDIVILVNDE